MQSMIDRIFIFEIRIQATRIGPDPGSETLTKDKDLTVISETGLSQIIPQNPNIKEDYGLWNFLHCFVATLKGQDSKIKGPQDPP